MFGSSPFSPHNDVLTATPSTTDEKIALVEELKRRGRVSVTTQRYPDAKDLYSKAIEVSSCLDDQEQQLAVLHSNRSLCWLHMSKAQESYDDAVSATCYDATYVKGFWRLAAACMALKKTQEAINAFESAIALDGSNKALQKEYEKAKKQLIKDEKEAEEKKEEIEAQRIKDATMPPPPKAKPIHTNSASTTKNNNEIADIDDNDEFTQSDHVRGYKVVNGKKTSFFHHEQTEEEKALIGDITPKRLDETQIPAPITTEKDVSAWNKAGTWEERDYTDWAIETIKSKILECEYSLPAGSPDPNAHIKVVDVTNLISSKVAGGTAHASVAKVRGKKRYIFEFNICVHWEITLGSGTVCKGTLSFLDVDGTHEIGDAYDVSGYTVDANTPSEAKYLLERFVRDGGLRNSCEKKLDEWIELFQETY